MEALTKREDQIGFLTAKGFSEKMIGVKLFIQECTVHTHKKNIRKKIGAANDKDVTRIYVLSNLQKFLVAMFLSIQVFAMYAEDNQLRRFKIGRKITRTLKNRRYELV